MSSERNGHGLVRPGVGLAVALLTVISLTAGAADTPPLKDNARDYLALRQKLHATTLTVAQMSGPFADWRGKTVELFGCISVRTTNSSPQATYPVSVALAVPGLTGSLAVDSAHDNPLLAVGDVVHILAELPADAQPGQHFILRAVISEDDLPAAEHRYAAALAAQAAAASGQTAVTLKSLPAPKRNAKPAAAPAPPAAPATGLSTAPPPARPGTDLPPVKPSDQAIIDVWKQWVSKSNPALSDQDLEIIVRSVLYYSALYGVRHQLVFAMIKCESDFDPKCLSSSGAMGLTQLMPCNAKDYNVDPWDPEQNIKGGVHQLADDLHSFQGQSAYQQCVLGLACYNAGTGAVKRAGGVPNIPETVRYVKKVSDLFLHLWQSGLP